MIRVYDEHIIGEKDGLTVYGVAVDISDGIVTVEEDMTFDLYIFDLSEVRPYHFHDDGKIYDRVIAVLDRKKTSCAGIEVMRYNNADGVSMVAIEADRTNKLYWLAADKVSPLSNRRARLKTEYPIKLKCIEK